MQSEDGGVSRTDAVIIGGGWSGILSLKCMMEEGLSAVLLEKRDTIGGIWQYSDDPNIPTVMMSTQCTSSSTVTELSDYPMPEEIGTFPHHTDIMEYMKNYARDFQLLPHIRLNTEVQQVVRSESASQDLLASDDESAQRWTVTCTNGRVYKGRFLVVATGVVQIPNRELEKTVLKGFTGPIHHACEIKSFLNKYKGKRLLLVGGGETASDICLDWHQHLEYIYWSIPRGQHFFRKFAKVSPWGKPQPLDKASSRMIKLVAPYIKCKPGLAWVCKWTSNGSLLAYQGHGIPEWKNDAHFFKFFINKNGKILDLVDYKTLVPKAGILKCEGKKVLFNDGTEQKFDFVITSTGYHADNHFLPTKYTDVKVQQRYKMIFDVDDPTIAFIGLARPIVGSIIMISEIQTRCMAKIYSGKVKLPPLEERVAQTMQDSNFWSDYFKDSSQRIEGLIEAYTYGDSVLKLGKIYPNFWSLFKRSPRKWFVAYFSPYNAATHRLNEEEKLEKSIQTMERHRTKTLSILQYLLMAFMRLIFFDWWIDILSEMKYRIQISPWWHRIRDWRLIRAANYVWIWPKRFLFNPKEHHNADVYEMSAQARSLMDSHNRHHSS